MNLLTSSAFTDVEWHIYMQKYAGFNLYSSLKIAGSQSKQSPHVKQALQRI